MIGRGSLSPCPLFVKKQKYLKNKIKKMANIEKLALIREILEEIESNLSQAKTVIAEALGTKATTKKAKVDTEAILQKAQELAQGEAKARIIQGIFNGRSMVAPDGAEYPVPANYASKSKIIQGDTLKLTISEDGSFIYKQIGPVERKKVLGILMQDESGDYVVISNKKSYKVLLASVTYFKGEPGDEVTLVIPATGDSEWGAVENIIKKKGLKEMVAQKGAQLEGAGVRSEDEKEVVPGQVVDDLDNDLDDNLEGLLGDGE